MKFKDLSEQQFLSLAISAEEEDGRVYLDLAHAMRSTFPATAELFQGMSEEKSGHRHRLIELYRSRFGEHIPLIRREDVKGFYRPKGHWLAASVRPEKARAEAAHMEMQSKKFYETALRAITDAATRHWHDDDAFGESVVLLKI